MGMKAGVSEALALIFAEKATVSEHDMVNFVARALPVQSVPFLLGLLSFPETLDHRRSIKRMEEAILQ